MANFQAQAGIFQIPTQTIYVEPPNGGGFRDVWIVCTSVTHNHGSAGASATFELPSFKWDDYRAYYSGALVTVYVYDNARGVAPSNPIFKGFITAESSQLNATTQQVTLTARSVSSLMDKVYIGQEDKTPYVEYLTHDKVTGRRTRWNNRTVLQDIFNNLPSFWKSYIRLGDISCFDSIHLELQSNLIFRETSYARAIEEIMSDCGDISYRETFNSGSFPHVSLDFFVINSASGIRSGVKVAAPNVDVLADGANVVSISENVDTAQSVNRVIGVGSPYKLMGSITNYEPDTEHLVKGWKNDVITVIRTAANGTTTTITGTREELVLQEPDMAKPGSPFFVQSCEKVFKLYYLPTCLRSVIKDKENCLNRIRPESSTGQPVPWTESAYSLIAFKVPKKLKPSTEYGPYGYGGGYGYDATDFFDIFGADDSDTPYALIDNVTFDPQNNTVEFKDARDTTNILFSMLTDDDTRKEIREPAKLGVTITVSMNDYLMHDTGQPVGTDVAFAVIGRDGITDRFRQESFQYKQLGICGTLPNGKTAQFKDINGNNRTYTKTVYFDEDTSAWTQAVNQIVLQNDIKNLKATCEQELKVKGRKHRSYNITVGYYTGDSYRVGDKVIVYGQNNYSFQDYAISNIDFDLIQQNTTLTVDNVKPPQRLIMDKPAMEGTTANAAMIQNAEMRRRNRAKFYDKQKNWGK